MNSLFVQKYMEAEGEWASAGKDACEEAKALRFFTSLDGIPGDIQNLKIFRDAKAAYEDFMTMIGGYNPMNFW